MKNYMVQVYYVTGNPGEAPVAVGVPQPLTAADHDDALAKARVVAGKSGKHVRSVNHAPGDHILVYVTDRATVTRANPPDNTVPVWRRPAGPKRL